MKRSEFMPMFIVDTSAAAQLSGNISSAASEAFGTVIKNVVLLLPSFTLIHEIKAPVHAIGGLSNKPIQPTGTSGV